MYEIVSAARCFNFNILNSEPRVKTDIYKYFKFLKVFSYELTFVYLIATRMLKVLEKYFAIWREGHNG